MPFHYTIERSAGEGEPLSIRLSGSMSLGPQLFDFGRRVGDHLTSHLTSRRPPAVFLDISAVTEVDSSGLGELVILYTTAGQHGCRLCLVSPTPRIIRLLETTKLSGILPHFESLAAAKASLS
jgi:anti-anti-sigma factor